MNWCIYFLMYLCNGEQMTTFEFSLFSRFFFYFTEAADAINMHAVSPLFFFVLLTETERRPWYTFSIFPNDQMAISHYIVPIGRTQSKYLLGNKQNYNVIMIFYSPAVIIWEYGTYVCSNL